jgi:hypothetical protein
VCIRNLPTIGIHNGETHENEIDFGYKYSSTAIYRSERCANRSKRRRYCSNCQNGYYCSAHPRYKSKLTTQSQLEASTVADERVDFTSLYIWKKFPKKINIFLCLLAFRTVSVIGPPAHAKNIA